MFAITPFGQHARQRWDRNPGAAGIGIVQFVQLPYERLENL